MREIISTTILILVFFRAFYKFKFTVDLWDKKTDFINALLNMCILMLTFGIYYSFVLLLLWFLGDYILFLLKISNISPNIMADGVSIELMILWAVTAVVCKIIKESDIPSSA